MQSTNSSSASSVLRASHRSWLSLWLVVHFFVLTICLIHNNGSSQAVRRVQQLTGPYSVGLLQDYGARPLEMTLGSRRSMPHLIQLHLSGTDDQQWETVAPVESPWIQPIDERWRNYQHMLALAADEDNEELINILLEHAAGRAKEASMQVDAVRLVRPAVLSYDQSEQYRDGRLLAKELDDTVLFEARIVSMPDDQIKLLPVLEPTRRAVSREGSP